MWTVGADADESNMMRMLAFIWFLMLSGLKAQDPTMPPAAPTEADAPTAQQPSDLPPQEPSDLPPQGPNDLPPKGPGNSAEDSTTSTTTKIPMPKRLPNWGYEPYWFNGNWAFKTTIPSTLEGSPYVTYEVCGEPCSYMIQRLGQVCVRMQDQSNAFDWCRSRIPFIWAHCEGRYLDNYNEAFYTYANYCIYLDDLCLSQPGRRPLVIHLGPCVKHNDQLYKPIFYGADLVHRKDSYLSSLKQRLDAIPTTTKRIPY